MGGGNDSGYRYIYLLYLIAFAKFFSNDSSLKLNTGVTFAHEC